jgi:hypothetical protein
MRVKFFAVCVALLSFSSVALGFNVAGSCVQECVDSACCGCCDVDPPKSCCGEPDKSQSHNSGSNCYDCPCAVESEELPKGFAQTIQKQNVDSPAQALRWATITSVDWGNSTQAILDRVANHSPPRELSTHFCVRLI